jgi:hypothetical protein
LWFDGPSTLCDLMDLSGPSKHMSAQIQARNSNLKTLVVYAQKAAIYGTYKINRM